VFLSDWTDERPERVFAKLKKQAHYYNFHERTVGDFFRDVRRQGLRQTLAERKAWGEMRMSETDLSDVSGYTYTYLLNGAPPAGNWTGLFQPGEKVLLRVINGSAMTYFDVRIPGLKMTVVAADGQWVRPVPVDEFRVAVAETFDVIVEPSGAEAFTIFAQSMDRTGYAAGTLASRPACARPCRTSIRGRG
jgi:CopA family copper-resistance protein